MTEVATHWQEIRAEVVLAQKSDNNLIQVKHSMTRQKGHITLLVDPHSLEQRYEYPRF